MPFQPYDQGYDATATKRPDPYGVNGWLTFRPGLKDEREIKLWVYNIETGFSMSGSTSQSYRTRSFFAHNMVQPSFKVSCQFPNQQLYGAAVEFIRSTQTTFDSALRLQVVSRFKGRNVSPNLRGEHQDLEAEGYVKSVPRRHTRHEYAPELVFDFIVERLISPADWADDKVTMRKLKSWNQIIEGRGSKGFVDDPDPLTSDTIQRPANAPGPNGELRPT